MAGIWIDGQTFEVDGSRNLLEVSLGLGFDLPYFCWHPAMGSVGACRQCAVKQFKDEDDETGAIVMACMTAASDGSRFSIADPEARRFRAGVVEWLMLNHPHDCPVCDEGGECHLQDMTVMTGHTYRRTRFPKRTYRNQDLGPFIEHEMNRCIQCYRCVRFYDDYAGGKDLQALGAHDHVYFGRQTDGTLESEFAGNLVEICPTGVFTDKSLRRHYTRKWDLQTAPSVCVHCGLGCNVTPGERYGQLRRIRARYHDKVNGYFLCDRGRYGYEFVNHERRIAEPLIPQGSERLARPVSADVALDRLASLLSDPTRVIAIGSPRTSLESCFALRTLVGEERFFLGVPSRDAGLAASVVDALRGPARAVPVREIERADAVFVLGEDLPETAPVAALALRQAVLYRSRAAQFGIPAWHDAAVRRAAGARRNPLFIATSTPTRLDPVASRVTRGAPEDLARLGHAVAHLLDPEAPEVGDLDPDQRELAEAIAAALKDAERPLILSGAGIGDRAVIQAAANASWALGRARDDGAASIFLALPEANSLGVALLGHRGLDEAFATSEAGGVDVAVVVETDLFRQMPRAAVEGFLSSIEHLVVLDHIATETGARADLLLPAATFAESHGSLVSCEGRAQRFNQVFVPEGEIRSSWRWLRDLMREMGRREAFGWDTIDDVIRALSRDELAFARLADEAPPVTERIHGSRIPRERHRASGRTARRAHLRVVEPPPPDDPDSPYAFSMEGCHGATPPAQTSEFWSPGWSSIQSVNRFQEEIGGPLRGGPLGARLIEPVHAASRDYYREVPEPFSRRSGWWRVTPRHHVFGSEELSMLSSGVAERAPSPYIALAREDADALGVSKGSEVEVTLGGVKRRLEVRIDAIPPGTAGVPVGLPELRVGPLPDWLEILVP